MIDSTLVGGKPPYRLAHLTPGIGGVTESQGAGWGLDARPQVTEGLNAAARFARDLCLAVPDLRRIARRFVTQDSLADDLVQLTCMRALERREQFLLGTNLLGWLTTVLRNLHRDELRRRRHQASLEAQLGGLTPAATEVGPTESPLWSHLGVEDVRRATNALPEEMREAYVLYTFEDLSYQAIARKLGVPMATVATRLYRARIKLRDVLSAGLDQASGPPCHVEDSPAESWSS